jgi:hypothetical protein
VGVRWVTRCGIIIAGIDVAGLTKISASEKGGAGDVLRRLEFPCSPCPGIALVKGAMCHTHGTSSGDVRRLATALSCALGVVSFQIKTCSFWFALVSVSCSRSLFQSEKKNPRQIETEANYCTSGLTGQHPRISVSTSRTSAPTRYDRPSTSVPGPLPFARAHLTGNAQSCALVHGYAIRGSSAVKLRSPYEVLRQLFLLLR